MSDKIRAALTAEEWRDGVVTFDNDWLHGSDIQMFVVRDDRDGSLRLGNRDCDGAFEADVLPPTRHALAALALHGQPFGYTWEMVDAIRECARTHDAEHGDGPIADAVVAQARAAADRIAALLPPRES